jgi:predicted ATPase
VEPTRQWYARRIEEIETQRGALRGTERTLNVMRAATFLAGVVLLGLGWSSWDQSPAAGRLLWWLGWAMLVAFFVVVTIHEQRRDRLEQLRNRRNVLRRLLARLERNWSRLPVWRPSWKQREAEVADSDIALADDLDLFGEGSLMQLVSMAHTGPGLRTLAMWLTDPALRETGQARSAAARSLVENREGRLDFYVRARRAAHSAAEPDAFCQWAGGPRWLAARGWLMVWAWLSPLIILGCFLGGALTSGAVAFDIARGLLWAGLPLVINLFITVWASGPVHGIFAQAVHRRGDIESYAEMFASGEALPAEPELVGDVRKRLVGGSGGATGGMRELAKLARWIVRRRGGVGYLFFSLLQVLMMWDIHLLVRLERWQKKYGALVDDWFAALGELEALQSLAALYDDYPQWAVPEWIAPNDKAQIDAEGLAHPLLGDDVRVSNDVCIGPTGKLLLVTGSNMSGKSTMLRAVGLNVVLAGAGGPVCANKLRLPSCELATSIRVRDSVKEGVSFYMAELHRLRDVVRQAREVSQRPDRMCVYLLDEILQGTNSRERAIAVVQVLRHLLASGAIGAISTHDLELADDAELSQQADVVHFRETIEVAEDGSESMRFDYLMRAGVTPTTNALRLLELVGL